MLRCSAGRRRELDILERDGCRVHLNADYIDEHRIEIHAVWVIDRGIDFAAGIQPKM